MTTELHPYYSYDKIMSYNAVFNIVSGARGVGKTYGMKEKCINKALKTWANGDPIDQFIYLRRYKNEITAAKQTFFSDIAHLWPDYDFRVNGNMAQFAPAETRDEKKREWHIMGYFAALSTAQSLKGTSFPLVKTIIFDEFIIERGSVHYLPDESTVLWNFYSTVDRWKDKTRVFMLSNAVSINNPYFLSWEIRPDESKEFNLYGEAFEGHKPICVHFPEASAFQSSVYKTRFGHMIANTEYAGYAVGNEFKDNNDMLIKVKDSVARYTFTLETKAGLYSIWVNDVENFYYAQRRQPRRPTVFTMDPALMDEDKVLLLKSDKLLQTLRTAFSKGVLWFDEPRTRNSLLDIFK